MFINNSGHSQYVANEVEIGRSALQSKFGVGGNWEHMQGRTTLAM